METDDLTSSMQEMMAEMASMRAELNDLKARAKAVVTPLQPVQSLETVVPTTRRKALLKLGGGLAAAGLSISLPILTTSAAPDQQVSPPGDSAGPFRGPDTIGVNPNATPSVVSNAGETQSFAGYSFRPVTLPTTNTFAISGGIIWTGGGEGSFLCPLQLPQGVKVTNVTFYFTNNDASNYMHFYLLVIDPVNETLSKPVDLSSTTPLAFPRTISATGTAANPVVTIDNTLYSYQLGVLFGGSSSNGNPNQTLWGAKVSYVNVTGHFQAQ